MLVHTIRFILRSGGKSDLTYMMTMRVLYNAQRQLQWYFASMATMSPADSLASSSVTHLQTFLSIFIVATWSKSAVQKKQIGSVDHESLLAAADRVRRVGVPVLDCCPKADSALLWWAMFYFVNFKRHLLCH